jgi:very-short-patch-repair endonuclease
MHRQRQLEVLGVSFLRFCDLEVKRDINNVLRTLSAWILNWEEQQDQK